MEIDKIVSLLNRITRFYLSCRIHSKEAVKYGNNLQSQELSSNVACEGQHSLGSWTRILNPGILANALLRPTLAKALHLPADTFLGHRYGFLENVEVCNHGKVVGGECCWRKPVDADLLLGGHVQGGWSLDAGRVEDVVEGALLLPSLPDLPGGEGCRVWIGRCKLLLDGSDLRYPMPISCENNKYIHQCQNDQCL